MFKRKSN